MAKDMKIEFQTADIAQMRDLQQRLKFWNPAEANAFRSGLRRAIAVIANNAKKKVPKLIGSAKKSIKPIADLGSSPSPKGGVNSSRGPGKAGFFGVKAGGDDVPYYKWLDFGGTTGRGHKMGKNKGAIKRKFLSDGRYLYPAVAESKSEVLNMLEAALDKAVSDLAAELEGGNALFGAPGSGSTVPIGDPNADISGGIATKTPTGDFRKSGVSGSPGAVPSSSGPMNPPSTRPVPPTPPRRG